MEHQAGGGLRDTEQDENRLSSGAGSGRAEVERAGVLGVIAQLARFLAVNELTSPLPAHME